MKKLIALSSFITASVMSSMAVNNSAQDTIAVINNPSLVTIIEQGGGKYITVQGGNGDEDYRFTYTAESADSIDNEVVDQLFAFNALFMKKNHSAKRPTLNIGGFRDIYTGMVIPANAAKGFSTIGWDIGMLNVLDVEWCFPAARSELILGLGWYYKRMPVSDGMMICGDGGNISLEPVDASLTNVRSHIKSFGLSIPLTYFCRIAGDFGVEIGAIAQLNTYTRAYVSSSENGVETKHTFKGLQQRLLTADALLRLGTRGDFAIYARYSPMSMFAPEHGPKTSNVSIGISLGF